MAANVMASKDREVNLILIWILINSVYIKGSVPLLHSPNFLFGGHTLINTILFCLPYTLHLQSPNLPTTPQERIRPLTSLDHLDSPFYDSEGGPITPVARVVIERLARKVRLKRCFPNESINVIVSYLQSYSNFYGVLKYHGSLLNFPQATI